MAFTGLTPSAAHRLDVSTREEAERLMQAYAGPIEILPGETDITWEQIQSLKAEFGADWEEAAHRLGHYLAYLYNAK